MRKFLLFVALVMGCAAVSNTAYLATPQVIIQAPAIQVVMPDGAWSVLKEAARASATSGVELGGCAKLVERKGLRFVVKDPYASAFNNKPRSLVMRCRPNEVLWHTHMQLELVEAIRCMPSPTDLANLGSRPLGLIVCGTTPQRVVAYGWKDEK